MRHLVFVDTNVLVYLRDSTEPDEQRRAAEWIGRLWDTGAGRVSAQVLREYYVTVTGKLDPGMPRREAQEDVLALGAWNPLFPDAEIFEDAWATEERYGFSFRDGARRRRRPPAGVRDPPDRGPPGRAGAGRARRPEPLHGGAGVASACIRSKKVNRFRSRSQAGNSRAPHGLSVMTVAAS